MNYNKYIIKLDNKLYPSVDKAAKVAGIPKTTLWTRIRKESESEFTIELNNKQFYVTVIN